MNEGNRGNTRFGGSDFGYGSSGYDDNRRQGSGNYGYQGDYSGNRGFGGSDYGYGRERSGRDYDRDRGLWDKTKDEVASWFGDEEADRRRRMDERRGEHRGKGPRGYTRSDERIKEDVNDRLSDDPHVDASEIDVSVNNGEVTLTGTVSSRWEKRHAEDIAESVSGVKHLENRLRVGTATGTSTTDASTFGTGVTGAATSGTAGVTRATTTGTQ